MFLGLQDPPSAGEVPRQPGLLSVRWRRVLDQRRPHRYDTEADRSGTNSLSYFLNGCYYFVLNFTD